MENLKEQINNKLNLLDKYETILGILTSSLKIELHHIKHSRYFTLWVGANMIRVDKETYELLKEVFDNGK